jgi:hypothetical protein
MRQHVILDEQLNFAAFGIQRFDIGAILRRYCVRRHEEDTSEADKTKICKKAAVHSETEFCLTEGQK